MKYIFFFLFLFSSCFLKRNENNYSHKNTNQEISDINCHETPKEIAEGIANLSKKQMRASIKQHRKMKRQIERRNKKKIKGKYYM